MRTMRLQDVARRRLDSLPSAVASAEVHEAKVAFFNAVVAQDYREARAAFAVFAPTWPCRSSPAECARLQQRVAVLVKWVEVLREQRLSGYIRPAPTPEQAVEATNTVKRLRRWLAGDDSAGPFE